MSGYRTRRKTKRLNKLPTINENSEYNKGYNNITRSVSKKYVERVRVKTPMEVFMLAYKNEDIGTLASLISEPSVKRAMDASPKFRAAVSDTFRRGVAKMEAKLQAGTRKTRRLRRR